MEMVMPLGVLANQLGSQRANLPSSHASRRQNWTIDRLPQASTKRSANAVFGLQRLKVTPDSLPMAPNVV
jgi:hypothetical protein